MRTVTWAGGDKAQANGTYSLLVGADDTFVPASKFSQFLQHNLFMPHVAEKTPKDVVTVTPGMTEWDCAPRKFLAKYPTCLVSMLQQPEWDMVLWTLNICNDGFKDKSLNDRCTITPAATAYFAKKGVQI